MQAAVVSIIIINYNSFEVTCRCIESVLQHTNSKTTEIILVDNASTEKDPQAFADQFPEIRLIASKQNGGFAAGNNLGIAASSGEYILLLNSDTLFLGPTLEPVLEKLQRRPNVSVLGCRMTYPDAVLQHTARRFRSISWELLDLFRFIPLMMPYRNRALLMLGKYFNADFDTDCDWVNGAFFLFRKSLLQELPGHQLDARFFMYGEDHLWCYQFRQLGYHCFFDAETTIIHLHNASTAPKKRLALRKTMLRHELQIMAARKGRGLYYYVFALIFGAKEWGRIWIKALITRLTGRVIR